jgi:hypothetical protein
MAKLSAYNLAASGNRRRVAPVSIDMAEGS